MLYHVSRAGQVYGPYTFEDIQRYISQGNVLLTDLAKSDEMAEWIPVAQLLGSAAPQPPAPAYPAQAGYAAPGYPAPAVYPASGLSYPDPPSLHWGLVLLFSFLTCGVFGLVWEGIQAFWVKKVMPESKVVLFYIIFIVLEVLNLTTSFGRMALIFGSHGDYARSLQSPAMLAGSAVGGIIGLGVFVMMIVFRFTMRNDLLRHFNGPDPVGLRLGGVMTFFFGGLYFQYHFTRINEIKQAARYRGAAI